jgi:L-gulono-1,4-lactone dehydrogenase
MAASTVFLLDALPPLSSSDRDRVLRAARPRPLGRLATWRDALGRQPTRGLAFEPRTRDELIAIVAEAARTATPIRAVGAGYATSGAAKPEGQWLDLRALRQTLPIAGLRAGIHPSSFVRVESGIVFDDLQRVLLARSSTLAGTEIAGRQTLAGAIATATHGSSIACGSIADSVASVELVILESERGRLVPRVVRLEPTDGVTCPRRFATMWERDNPMDLVQDDALFYGALVGLGASGIACAYTLAVTPYVPFEEKSFRVSWARLASSLSELARAHDSVEVTLYPHPTGALAQGASGATRDDAISCGVTTRDPVGVVRLGSGIRPQNASESAVDVTAAPSSGVTLGSSRLRPGARGRTSAMEISVHLDDAAHAVFAILDEAEAMRREGFTHSGPITLRFVAPSRHALAMNAGRPTCSIEVALLAGAQKSSGRRSAKDSRTIVRRVQDAVDDVAHAPRPNWGMPHELSGVELATRYPDAAEWRRACRAFDPRGSFLNPMTRTLLWGPSPT